ncbi:MAG: PEP-utilizing enzyme [Actinomycetota bacterium]
MTLPEAIVAVTADGPDLDPAVYGAKAVGLQRLMRLGLPVPPALVVPVASARAIATDQTAGRDELRAAVRTLGGPGDRLAVRSGAAVSLPGAFETLLDVLPSVVDAAVVTVVESTRGLRVETIARALGHDRVPETAVVIQRQVDATADARSGAGAASSRHPVTGEPGATGSYVWQVRGDAVMAATTPVLALDAMSERAPEAYARLLADLQRLDAELDSAVEVEFTVESGEIAYLQLRTFEVTTDTAELPAGSLVIAEGQPASAGVGRGRVFVDVDDALDAGDRGEPVVLVLETSAPADMTAMVRSAAVLTIMGGRESHAAVVTRGAGVPAVLAVQGLQIAGDHILLGDRRIEVGEELVVDGTTGRIARPPLGD